MAGPTDLQEKRLADLKRETTRRGFDRHASRLKDISELAGELQSPEIAPLAAREAIQTIIVFPPQIRRGREYVPRQALLFTPTRVIHLLASIWPDQKPQLACVLGSGLMYMRVKLLLLYGYLEIVAQGPEAPTRLAVEFNTVAWHHLSRPVRQLLQATGANPASQAQKESPSLTAQRAFAELPLKFSNGLKIYGLLPGEELEEFVFQPGIWTRRLAVFRRPLVANTLLMLTSNFMVVIQEELMVSQGWILTYIRRACINEMQDQGSGLTHRIIVSLKQGEQIAEHIVSLGPEAVEAWRASWLQRGGSWRSLPG